MSERRAAFRFIHFEEIKISKFIIRTAERMCSSYLRAAVRMVTLLPSGESDKAKRIAETIPLLANHHDRSAFQARDASADAKRKVRDLVTRKRPALDESKMAMSARSRNARASACTGCHWMSNKSD